MGAVYQQIPPSEYGYGCDKRLSEKAWANGQDVYYLAGDSRWAIQKDAEAMLQAVETVKKWNKEVSTEGGFSGIVWDVEPHLLERWTLIRLQ